MPAERQLADEAADLLASLGYRHVAREVQVGAGARAARADLVGWGPDESGALSPLVLVEVKGRFGEPPRRGALAQLAAYANVLGTAHNFVYDGSWHEADPSFVEFSRSIGPRPSRVTGRPSVSREAFAQLLRDVADQRQGPADRIGSRDWGALLAASSDALEVGTAFEPGSGAVWGSVDWVRAQDKDLLRHAATPEPVARAMAQLLRPSSDSVVLDPACGIGSILWAAADWAQAEGVRLRYEGQDISPALTDLASAIARLSGEEVEVRCVDSLTAEANRVDYIACDPPMGARLSSPYLMADGSPTTHADFAFVDRALSLLRPRGRAVLLVRRAVLGGGGAARRLREALLGRARVTAIIGLPPGVLEPFTGLSPALLVLEDATPTQALMAELREDWSEQLSPGGDFLREYLRHLEAG